MGKTYTPKYRIEFLQTNCGGGNTPMCWDIKNGRPTNDNLEKYLDAYSKSCEMGGVNDHISAAIGFIPVVLKAVIINQRNEEIVASYQAPLFKT